MTKMTEGEWDDVCAALCRGGLREHLDTLLTAARTSVQINSRNRHLLTQAYDDGDGNVLDLSPSDDPPWFTGECGGFVLMEGMEHDGTLYSIARASGGMVSLFVGRGLIENEEGVAFHSVVEAKAYVQGLLAR